MPSLSSSPTVTMTVPMSPRLESKRPARHHMRSHSTDAVPSTSSFIFVQPATPNDKPSSASNSPQPWSSTSQTEAGPSSSSTSGTSPLPLAKRRIKLFGFTPAVPGSGDEGPSSQDESSSANEGFQSDDLVARPRSSLSIANPGSMPPRRQSSPSASASHVAHIQASFPSRTTAMVRKKSGELVRSSLKTSDSHRKDKPRSAPATPVCPKYVHFDTQLEHVKHFLAQQRPAAVSRSGSPIETETEDEPEAFPFPAMASAQAGTVKLKLPNFPARVNHDQDVYMESLEMAKEGKSIRGIVRVRNLSFEKWVAVRFTLDHWQTVSEVSAEHLESMGSNSDRFVFSIRLQDLLARIEEKTMFVAVRYTVGGREIWDNNDGQNYRVEFTKVPSAPAAGVPQRAVGSKGQGAWSVTSAGQASERMADLRRELDRLTQDDDGPPSPRKFDTRNFTEGSPAVLHNRYDFGASLKQAPGPRPGASFTASQLPVSTSPPKQSASFMSAAAAGAFNLNREPMATPTPLGLNKILRVNEAPRELSPQREGSPVLSRDDLPPNFGDSSFSTYQSNSPLYNPAPLYPPPMMQQQQRPPSPPSEMTLKQLYAQYSSSGSIASGASSVSAVPTRFHSYPSGRVASAPMNAYGAAAQYSPLLPPSFRDHRRRDSPFVSPVGSPYGSPAMSPAISPAMSPSISPAMSPAMSPVHSPGRVASPPLYPTVSPPPEAGVWSPGGSSSDTLSQSSSMINDSPDSEATSVPESPSQGPYPRPSGPLEFSTFLDKVSSELEPLLNQSADSSLPAAQQYCFHTSFHPGSLGLMSVTPELSPALTPGGYGSHSGSDTSLASPSTTPRRSTPISNGPPPMMQAQGCNARVYYSGSPGSSSGSSTPASRSQNDPNPLEGFAQHAFSTSSASAIVS